MLLSIGTSIRSGCDTPRNTSQSIIASANVRASVSLANRCLVSVKFSRPEWITPVLSSINTLSISTPVSSSKLVQAIAAAPAPETTTFTLLISLSTTRSPFLTAAEQTIAVPC